MAQAATYGARARLGLIVPPTNTVNESEWRIAVPEGVSFHTHRMPLHTDLETQEGRAALDRDLDAAFAMVLPAAPAAIAYACTAGSMVDPVESLPDALAQRHGVRAVTTSAAIVSGLRKLNAKRLVVASPYTDAMNAHEATFLAAHGFYVAAISGRGIGPDRFTDIAHTPLGAVRSHAIETFGESGGADALVLLCTDYPTLPLVAELEAELGLPVVTSNQATLVASLRAAGLQDAPPMLGRLAALP
ncbi:MAG: hypothetical protein AAF321_04665 [Pseudomonadota bacterium]